MPPPRHHRRAGEEDGTSEEGWHLRFARERHSLGVLVVLCVPKQNIESMQDFFVQAVVDTLNNMVKVCDTYDIYDVSLSFFDLAGRLDRFERDKLRYLVRHGVLYGCKSKMRINNEA
jgi:hypothetical protein